MSAPAAAREPWSAAKAVIVTSVAPRAKPTGAVAATMVRTPGRGQRAEQMALVVARRPAARRATPATPTSTTVPTSTKPQATSSATAGEATTTIAAVSSGPVTKTSSMAMPSSA